MSNDQSTSDELATTSQDKPESAPVERCPCGYPMPCSTSVPIDFCRAVIGDTETP